MHARSFTQSHASLAGGGVRRWSWGSIRIQTLVIIRTCNQTIGEPLNYLIDSSVKFINASVVENAIEQWWWLSDAVKFRLPNSITNANCISIDTSTIVKASDLSTNFASWIIGMSISNEHNINTIGRRVETTALAQKNIACTSGCSCCMSVSSSISDVLNCLGSIDSFMTCITIAIETKFQVVIVIECHHSNFHRSAHKFNKLANAVFHFCKVPASNASRCIKEEKDVLSSIRVAIPSLTTESMMMFVPFKW